jgi:hypothetical protein
MIDDVYPGPPVDAEPEGASEHGTPA